MKLTFQEFSQAIFKINPDPIPQITEEGWIHQVSEAIKAGQNVSDRVLSCHSEIYFDQTGCAHYRKWYIKEKEYLGY